MLGLEFAPQNTYPTRLHLKGGYKTNWLLCGWAGWRWLEGEPKPHCCQVTWTQGWGRELLFPLCPKAPCLTLWHPSPTDLHVYHLASAPLPCPLGHFHILLQKLVISGKPEQKWMWAGLISRFCVWLWRRIKCVYMCRAVAGRCAFGSVSICAVCVCVLCGQVACLCWLDRRWALQ